MIIWDRVEYDKITIKAVEEVILWSAG